VNESGFANPFLRSRGRSSEALQNCEGPRPVLRIDRAMRRDWLPAREPHVPGRNHRPADESVSRIARKAPRPTDPQAWRDNEAYLAGLHLYANGFYWEAHEVWEPVWMNASPNSQERELTQGLIQLANAALKLKMAQPAAAARLAGIAEKHFREAALGAARIVMGVDLEVLVKRSNAFAGRLERKAGAEAPVIPLIGEG
jgi:uncharacterized protein